MDNKIIPLKKWVKCLTSNIWLRNFTFQNFRTFIPGKISCQVSIALGVLFLILIVYYMTNLSREELSTIFHKNPINMLTRCLLQQSWRKCLRIFFNKVIWLTLIFAFKKQKNYIKIINDKPKETYAL